MSHGASSDIATPADVLVVGAGPTGLVLAIWLTRFGVSVRVIDKSPEPADESRALGVHARTLEFYRQVDLADRVIEDAVQVAGINFWVGGRRFARLPVKDSGQGQTPYPSTVSPAGTRSAAACSRGALAAR